MTLVGKGLAAIMSGHHAVSWCCEVPDQDVRAAAALGTVPLHIPKVHHWRATSCAVVHTTSYCNCLYGYFTPSPPPSTALT